MFQTVKAAKSECMCVRCLKQKRKGNWKMRRNSFEERGERRWRCCEIRVRDDDISDYTASLNYGVMMIYRALSNHPILPVSKV